MKKRLLSVGIVASSLFAAQGMFAQTATTTTPIPAGSLPNRGCAAMEYKEWQEKNDPSIKVMRDKIEAEAQAYIENAKKNPTPQAVITIPVVFHIVYNTAAENVSDACINAQLQVINDDYRKLNADISKVTQPGFAALMADCEIQFCLAVRDPNNQPTNGITRTSTTSTSFSTNDAVKYAAQGGHDVWDRNKYFNVWICDLSGGLLGYGQFPGGPAATDGLVCDYQYMMSFASCGTPPYDKGRTSTHELGHCFGLRHIWGDDGTACTGSDQVADTPNQAGEHYGCFTAGSIQTDACSASSPGTMWMNYMDYTDDACMYSFTTGQKGVITATMNGSRVSLKTSNGCTPLTAVEYLLSSESMSLYPNPSTGDVSLNVNIPNITAADVTVYNAVGDVVLEKNVTTLATSSEIKLDMNSQPNGMYLVKLKTAEGAVTKKVVIDK